jgi:hypothetical protein
MNEIFYSNEAFVGVFDEKILLSLKNLMESRIELEDYAISCKFH